MTNKGFTVENLLRYLKKLSGGSFPEGCAGAILLYQWSLWPGESAAINVTGVQFSGETNWETKRQVRIEKHWSFAGKDISKKSVQNRWKNLFRADFFSL